MALTAYLTLKGKIQGDIKGDVIQKGVEGQIAVYAANHQVMSAVGATPASPATKTHKPLLITKEVDRSTPLLYKALAQNEVMAEYTLRFYAPRKIGMPGTGPDYQHYTIKLVNARIASIESIMDNIKLDDIKHIPIMEEVAFTYESIEWKWMLTGATSTDTWLS